VDLTAIIIIAAGVLVGIGAACSGMGGGFLMIPFLLALGFTPQKAVGTTFLGIFLIAASSSHQGLLVRREQRLHYPATGTRFL
jgi:uncharacterized membrane protein YfcA